MSARIAAYLVRRHCGLQDRLGAGMDGTVYAVTDNSNHARFAVKFHRSADGFQRERGVYLRLKEHALFEVCGFSIPEMLSWDEAFLAIEMTIVDRPFLLDFANAWVDELPEFTPDPYGDEERRERFGDRWPIVQRAIDTLRSHGIFMLDISPGNIAFLE
jgi:hypothetical protein